MSAWRAPVITDRMHRVCEHINTDNIYSGVIYIYIYKRIEAKWRRRMHFGRLLCTNVRKSTARLRHTRQARTMGPMLWSHPVLQIRCQATEKPLSDQLNLSSKLRFLFFSTLFLKEVGVAVARELNGSKSMSYTCWLQHTPV